LILEFTVIRNETGIGEELVVWHLDLCEFSSVKAFADKFEAEGGGRLDLFIANAAMGTRAFQKTDDGWEKAWVISLCSSRLTNKMKYIQCSSQSLINCSSGFVVTSFPAQDS